MSDGFVIVAALALAALLTGIVRRHALRQGMLDVPNDRSSHTVATPRGGGIALTCASLAAWLALHWMGRMPSGLLMALAGGGGIVAAIGYADDRRSVSPGVRLVAHFGAAAWALFWMGGLPPIQVGVTVHDLGLAGDVIAAFGIVWVLNLFNFMDGIDGIAATEAIFITGVGAFLSWWLDSGSGVSSSMLVIAAASSGFLVWNWPPARIFMGDVGSGFLGFVVAVLALAAARTAPASLFVWLILGGCFFADATVTLVRRVLRGVRVHDAHREHAYQRLSRRWQSHRAVDLVFIAVNAGWLAPCAWLATTRPDYAAWLAGIALFPLVVAAALVGAGRPE